MIPTPEDVHDALARIAPYIIRTPMLRSAYLDRQLGATVLFKAEVLQRTGSFKLRGATNALRRLSPETLARGIVAYSSGNHAQGIACAAASLGAPSTIIMPADAPAIKRQLTEFWGARVVEYDRATESREEIAAALVARTGATLIPPYEHPDVIAGQGTLALELAADAAAAGLAMDRLIVPAGGGGLIAGCALAMSSVSPGTKIHAAEPVDWDDTARSLASGQRERNAPDGSTFCDAILTPTPGELTFSINRTLLAGGLTATDDEVRAAIAYAARHLKLTVEPGGAVAFASLLAGRLDVTDEVIGVVLSGGNTDF
jgi:threonine dehydratase